MCSLMPSVLYALSHTQKKNLFVFLIAFIFLSTTADSSEKKKKKKHNYYLNASINSMWGK